QKRLIENRFRPDETLARSWKLESDVSMGRSCPSGMVPMGAGSVPKEERGSEPGRRRSREQGWAICNWFGASPKECKALAREGQAKTTCSESATFYSGL